MLVWLAELLTPHFTFFNVFSYLTFRAILSIITGLVVALWMGPRLIRRLQSEGVTIVYISHRMEEVFELADRVSVLRDGTHVGTRLIGETNDAELISLMINRSIEQIYHKEKLPIGATILEAKNLSGPGFSDVSLSVRAGEIVGQFGIVAGQRRTRALSHGADTLSTRNHGCAVAAPSGPAGQGRAPRGAAAGTPAGPAAARRARRPRRKPRCRLSARRG